MAKPGDRARAAATLRRVLAPRQTDPDARAVAQEVYEAAVTLKAAPGDPLPLAIRGPLFAIGARAAQVVASQHPDAVRSEDDAMDVIAYLTEVWCAAMLGFDRAHFEAWRRRRSAEAEGGPLEPPPG